MERQSVCRIPLDVVPDRFISSLLASPSGTGASLALLEARVMPRPSCWAFLKSSFSFRMASFKFVFAVVFFGPPVMFRAALPRRMLFLSSSGAT